MLDKDTLALLGDSEAFGKKIAEYAKAKTLADASIEALKAREVAAFKAEKAALAAETRLAGNEQNHREALEKFKQNEASFKAQMTQVNADLKASQSALQRRETMAKERESNLLQRETAIGKREQSAREAEDAAKRAIADFDRRRAEVQKIMAP